jgi:hypothetical protein
MFNDCLRSMYRQLAPASTVAISCLIRDGYVAQEESIKPLLTSQYHDGSQLNAVEEHDDNERWPVVQLH